MNVFAGVIWHYWLAVPLAVGGVALTVATLVGYFQKVSSTRYPKRRVRRPLWRRLPRR